LLQTLFNKQKIIAMSQHCEYSQSSYSWSVDSGAKFTLQWGVAGALGHEWVLAIIEMDFGIFDSGLYHSTHRWVENSCRH
jgi:hypothetical protein